MLGSRTLLVAPGLTSSEKLLGTNGIATSSGRTLIGFGLCHKSVTSGDVTSGSPSWCVSFSFLPLWPATSTGRPWDSRMAHLEEAVGEQPMPRLR